MANVNADDTGVCAREGCDCKVTDDEDHFKNAMGVFCCRGCYDDNGCDHPGCNCASKTER